MEVGFVCYGDIETNTGGFRYDRKLIAGLRERGDHVEIIELPWRDYRDGLLDSLTGRLFDRFDTSFDIVLHDELAHPSLVGCNRRLDVPTVAIVHHLRCSEPHPSPQKRLYRAVERRYLTGVDGAICNSEATREAVEALTTLKTIVAPPAGDRFDPEIPPDEIETRATEDGPLRVVFLGNLLPRKGLDTLIEGLSRLPDERWRLCVIGSPNADPKYASSVRRRVAALGLDEQVRFADELADDEAAAVLRASHVLAMPSAHEGFGIAYLEGMSFGLPALATTAGGAREVVSHGENGFLLRPGDPDEIARVVRTLTDHREQLTRMGTVARERYENWPTWTESVGRIRTFLEQIVSVNERTNRRVRHV